MRKIKIVRVIKGKKDVYMVYCPKVDDIIPIIFCRGCKYYLGGAARALFCSFGEEEEKKPLPIKIYGF